MIYHPSNKQAQFLQALVMTERFCQVNGMSVPKIAHTRNKHLQGLYRSVQRDISINIDGCEGEFDIHGLPGFRDDSSVIGVVAHELGHHWHYWNLPGYGYSRLSNDYREHVAPYERGVSSYCHGRGPIEKIAEAFRLFVTNPTLLAELSPFHYIWFLKHGLRPIQEAHWRDILARRPDRVGTVDSWLNERAAKTI